MYQSLFITGTDTGVGKTVITGLLGRYLTERGLRAVTQKWIQTGSGACGDIDVHRRLMKKKKGGGSDPAGPLVPYSFRYPASPHLAARLEKRNIRPQTIKKRFRELLDDHDVVVVEGVGGALVPYAADRLVIDIAKELKMPVLIVAANRLGAINHTLLTIEAVRARGMRILGVVFNETSRSRDAVIREDNPAIVRSVSRAKILGALRWSTDAETLYRAFRPIGSRIAAQLTRG
ncbi:MAG: dethiobiotin synthase [Candidatus Omnitrophota bacterium]